MTISLATNTLLPQPPVKSQDSRTMLGMATRVRKYSSGTVECASTKFKTDPLKAAWCKHSKTRANAAAAHDSLHNAVYDDMIREIDHHMETNPEALKELPALGPKMEELKRELQVIRDGSEEEYRADVASEKLGKLYTYTNYTLPEYLTKLDKLWDSLWESRREQTMIQKQKLQWCGRWCGDENCPPSPENNNVKESHKPESQTPPEDETEKLKMRSLSLLSAQLRGNRVLVQQVKDQKKELDEYKLRLEAVEMKVKDLEDEALRNADIEVPGEEAEDGKDDEKTPTKKDDFYDQQERLYEAWNGYDDRINFGHRGVGKS